MLGGAGDDVVAATIRRSSDALKRKVVRFGRAGSKDDLLRACTDQCRDFRTRVFDRRCSAPPNEML